MGHAADVDRTMTERGGDLKRALECRTRRPSLDLHRLSELPQDHHAVVGDAGAHRLTP